MQPPKSAAPIIANIKSSRCCTCAGTKSAGHVKRLGRCLSSSRIKQNTLCIFASAVCVAFPQRAHLLARLKPRPAVHDSVPTSNGAAHSAFTKHSKSLSSDAQVLPVAKLLCHHSASWQARLRSVENAAKFQPARGMGPTKRCTSRQNTIWRHQRWLAVGRSRDKVLRTRGDVTVPRKWRVMMSHVQSHVSTHEGSISRNLSAQVRVSLGPRYACGEASRWCRTGGVE